MDQLKYIIENHHADLGRQKTQDEWVSYFRGKEDQSWYASLAEIFHYIRFLKPSPFADQNTQANIDDFLCSWRYDMDYNDRTNEAHQIISSTRIKFEGKRIVRSIIHGYGHPDPSQINQRNDSFLPQYSLKDMLNRNISTLQALFQSNMKESFNERYTEYLEFLTGVPKENIMFLSPKEEGIYVATLHYDQVNRNIFYFDFTQTPFDARGHALVTKHTNPINLDKKILISGSK